MTLPRLLALLLAFVAAPTFAGTINLWVEWPTPQFEDGSTITDTANLSVRIYESKDGGPYVERATAKWASPTRFSLTSTNTRPFCWRATGVLNGAESAPTKEVCAHYLADNTCVIPKPLDATQPGACAAGTKGTWTQTSSSFVAPFPTCWSPGPFLPTSPPTGACVPLAPASPPTPTIAP